MSKTTPPRSQEQRQSDLAPETHNDEQDDHRSQAQEGCQAGNEPEARRDQPARKH